MLGMVANLAKNRMLFMKELREGKPINPIMCTVIVGLALTTRLEGEREYEVGDFRACWRIANHLLDAWWSHWKQLGKAFLLLFPELKHVTRHWRLGTSCCCTTRR